MSTKEHFCIVVGIIATVTGFVSSCSVNLCLSEVSGLICQSSSVALIQHVTCLTKGQSCDASAYTDVTDACSGRPICAGKEIIALKKKYCTNNTPVEHSRGLLSVLFINYACIKAKAIGSGCSRSGSDVDPTRPYVWSTGYPYMVAATSMCRWRIPADPDHKVDIRIQDYRHVTKPGRSKAFVRVRQTKRHGIVVKMDSTARRNKRMTLAGDVEVIMFTYGSTTRHRLWLQYRVLSARGMEYLEPFKVTNQTHCGVVYTNVSRTVTPATAVVGSSDTSPNVFTIRVLSADQQSIENTTDETTKPDTINEAGSTKLSEDVPLKRNIIVIAVGAALTLPLLLGICAILKHKKHIGKYWIKRKKHQKLRSRDASTSAVSSPSPVPSHCTQTTECDTALLDAADYALLNTVCQPIDFSKYMIAKYRSENPEETSCQGQYFRPIYTPTEEASSYPG